MSRPWIILAVASASTFLFVLDAGFLAVAFPAIEADFVDSSRATLSWVSIGYFVLGAPSLLVGAALGDRFGRSRLFVIGLVLFAVGALGTSLAPSVALLITARGVQGIGVGLLGAMSLALVLPEFPTESRGLAVGAWGASGSLAALLAPTGGAVLVEALGWRPTFGLLAPIAGVAAVMGSRLLPDTRRSGLAGLDPVGMVAAAVMIAAVASLVSLGNEWGWTSLRAALLLAVAVIAAGSFVVASRRRPGAVLDGSLLRDRNWLAGTTAASIQQLGFLGMFFSTPLVLVNIWEWSVLEAGLGMSLAMAVSTVVAPLGGRLADRRGHRNLIVVGAAVFAAGMSWWWVFIDLDDAAVHFGIGAALVGAGGALCGNLTTSAALRKIDHDRMAVASGTLSTSRRLFAGIGVAISVVLLGEADGELLLAGARRVWIFVAVATAAMIPAALALDRE